VAIGIVMGNAVAKVISGIVEGLIIAALVNFFAISIVVFFMVKYVFKAIAPEGKEEKDA